MPMPLPKGVSRQQWERSRNRAIEAAHGICRYCSQPLNPTAPRYAWDSTEVDHMSHVTPFDICRRRRNGPTSLTRTIWSPVHRLCNQKKSDNAAPELVGAQSREW